MDASKKLITLGCLAFSVQAHFASLARADDPITQAAVDAAVDAATPPPVAAPAAPSVPAAPVAQPAPAAAPAVAPTAPVPATPRQPRRVAPAGPAALRADCVQRLAEFTDVVTPRRLSIHTRLTPESRGTFSRINQLNQVRDWFREKLQRAHKHKYPVMAINDAPLALAWAKNAVGLLDDESKALLKIDEVDDELVALVDRMELWPRDRDRFLDRATNLAIERKALEKKLGELERNTWPIEVDIPMIETTAEGVQLERPRVIPFASRVEVQIRLDEIRGSRLRGGEERALVDEMDRRAYEQAVGIKKLETYAGQLEQVQALHSERTLPEEYKQALDRIRDLYTAPNRRSLKHEFRPPSWAWHELKWVQLWYEIKSIGFREAPEAGAMSGGDKKEKLEKLKNLLKYVQNLSDDEKRALGLQNVTEATSLYARTRWGRLIVAGGGSALGLGTFSWRDVAQFFAGPKLDKEKCVAMASEYEYLECAANYLKERFPGKFLAEKYEKGSFMDDAGKINDPKIIAEINDIRERRHRYMFNQNLENAVSQPAKLLLESEDMSSETFRSRLIYMKDQKEFKKRLLSFDERVGYLKFKYSVAYSKEAVSKVVYQAVEAKTPEDRDLHIRALKAMPFAVPLAEDLDGLLRDHAVAMENPDQGAGPDYSSSRTSGYYNSNSSSGNSSIDSTLDAKIEDLFEDDFRN